MIDAARGGAARAVPWLLLAPALALVGVLAVAVGALLDDSLRTLDRNTFRLSTTWSLANYAEVARSPTFATTATRTVLGAAVASALTLLLATPYAYVMVRTRHAWRRKLLLFCLFMPFFIGQVVRAYSWLLILGKNGVINTSLRALGIPALDLIYNLHAVVFGLAQYLIPTAVLLIAPALMAASQDFEDASANLGASWWRTMRHVVLPIASPGLLSAAAVVFTISLTDFAMPAMLGAGRADFLANVIHGAYFELSDAGQGAAMAMILLVIGTILLIGLLALAQRLVPQGRVTAS